MVVRISRGPLAIQWTGGEPDGCGCTFEQEDATNCARYCTAGPPWLALPVRWAVATIALSFCVAFGGPAQATAWARTICAGRCPPAMVPRVPVRLGRGR